MSDYDFPDLPSDEDLGITDEDRKAFEEEMGDGPEMSDKELEALLGDSPARPLKAASASGGAAPGAAGASAPSGKPKTDKKAARAEAKAAKKAAREAARAEAKASKAKKKAAAATSSGDGASGGSEGSGRTPAAARSTALTGGRTKWRGPATVLALVAIAWLSAADRYSPRPVPANADESVFSSARAMATLIEIARAPHPPGSPEHARVREFLVDHLRDMGLEPEVQTGVADIQRNGQARLVTTRNIVARIPGTDPTGAFLITAHYDARDQSLGAADAGSGVVAILEAVRAAQTHGDFRNDVIILITDAEELGLMGARVYAAEHPSMADVKVAVSLEMRGSAGPSIMFETKDQNGWIIREWAEADPHAYAYSLSFEVYQRMPNDTDYSIFRDAGVQGLNFAGIDGAPAYHQRYDDPAHLSEATLQHHGEHALATLLHFGNADLTETDAPNVVYTTLPLVGMVIYEPLVGYGLSAFIVFLFALAFVLAQRQGARASAIGASALLSIVTAGLTGAVGFAVLRFIPQFHGELGGLQGASVYGEGWYLLGLVGAAITLVWGTTMVARRRMHLSELVLGAALVPSILGVVLGFAMPLVAIQMQWPAIAVLVGLVVVTLSGDRFGGHPSWIGGLMAAAVVLLVLIPVLEVLALAMTIQLAVGLGILGAIIVQLCLPLLDALRHPNDWWAPFGALAATVAFFAIGVLSAGPSAERPYPSTLAYAYEHGTGDAYWVTEPTEHPEDQLANDWVAENAGAFDERMDLSAFGYARAQAAVSKADVPDAPRPEIVTLRNDVNGRTRVVDLAIRSRIGAEALQIRLGEAGTTRLISVAGVPIEDPAGLSVVEHWGVPEHDYLLLELEAPEGEPLDLYVVEHLLRPHELVDASLFERPPELTPNPNWLSDRVMLRTSVADFADPSFALTEVDPVPEGLLERLRGNASDGGASPDAIDGEEVDPDDAITDSLAADTTASDTLDAGSLPDTLPVVSDSIVRDTAVVDTIPTFRR